MRVGIVGLGKLGLPIALAIQARGVDVIGTDTSAQAMRDVSDRRFVHREATAPDLLAEHGLPVASLREVVQLSEIIFVAVQTPHAAEYEGTTRLPYARADFDYSYLMQALLAIGQQLEHEATVAVISTCLPGTYRDTIKPHLDPRIRYVYNPSFIAMGSTVADFYAPEFLLIGYDDERAARLLRDFYHRAGIDPFCIATDIATAEAIKVSYNSFVTAKTVLANVWGELSDRMGLNVDDIYRAWSLSTDRLLSPRYLEAGMGDGGGCHPRDNIALSWLAREVGLSYDLFESLMLAREKHAEWIASLLTGVPCILGRSFKAGTDIESGSPALLVANILNEQGRKFIHVEQMPQELYSCYLIATRHPEYAALVFPRGSMVVDPFGIIADQEGVNVVRLGRK